MDNYSSFSVTTRGYSHIVKGTCCEDSSSHVDSNGVHIGIIADGHGDRKCFRSAIGSGIAVDIAEKDLLTFADSIEKTKADPKTERWLEKLFQKESADSIGKHLGQSIIVKWTNYVNEHFENNPVADEEIADSGISMEFLNNPEVIPHIYGTTLIAALLTEDYLIVVHQGDGRCVVVHHDGTIDQPVPWDSRCEGRETTSLCDEDAVDSCRYYINNQKEKPVIACFVASDGVEDSFESQEEVNAFFGLLTAKYVELGPAGITEYLESMLPDFSKLGSRDDVSIAGIVNGEAAAPFAEKFSLISELRSHEAAARKAKNKLDSMFRKMEFLTDEYEKAKADYNAAAKVCENASHNLETVFEKLRLAKIFKIKSESDRNESEKAYLDAKKEFDEYNERHTEFVQILEEANKQIEITKKRIAVLDSSKLSDSGLPAAAGESQSETADNEINEQSGCELSINESVKELTSEKKTDKGVENEEATIQLEDKMSE